LKNLFGEKGGDPSLALRMTKSPEKRFLMAILGSHKILIE